jgi:lipooligosaccharide transport system permease protein
MLLTAGVDTAVAIAERRAGMPLERYYAGRPHALLERGVLALRSSSWFIVLSGFFEPVFYLVAFGFGIGQLIGGVTDGSGKTVAYAAFIAPALLATSAMNGAIYDSTWNVFFKMRFAKTYEAMLSTSMGPLDVALGEITWALLRGLAYAIGFMAVVTPLGLVTSWWALMAIPVAVLVSFGFASIGMALTSYVKSFQQMNWINFFMLPMFLFSGSFYPITVYPEWLQWVIQAFPLWHAIDMTRAIMLGTIDASLLGHVLYFCVMIVVGLTVTTKRLTALFMR